MSQSGYRGSPIFYRGYCRCSCDAILQRRTMSETAKSNPCLFDEAYVKEDHVLYWQWEYTWNQRCGVGRPDFTPAQFLLARRTCPFPSKPGPIDPVGSTWFLWTPYPGMCVMSLILLSSFNTTPQWTCVVMIDD